MSVELELQSSNGNFSFVGPGREFLDVEAGRGMEPGDPKFTEKVFAKSLLKQGATLALETLHEKELVFPLKLHASTKDGVTAAIREINMIVNTAGCLLKWKDEGASAPTYFNLISGQLDDEYDFRVGQNNWLKCRLRLFTQPLGVSTKLGPRALTISSSATTISIGTAPLATFTATGMLAGDAAALIQAQLVAEGTEAISKYLAFSVLPASYVPFIPAPSMPGLASHSFVTAANTPGATYAHVVNPEDELAIWKAPSTTRFSYVGEQRLLVLARTPSGASVQPIFRRSESDNEILGISESMGVATPAATSAWQTLDLGAISTASSTLALNAPYGFAIEPLLGGGASRAIDVAAVVQLPEISTCFVNTKTNSGGSGEGLFAFDGISNAIWGAAYLGVPASGISPSSTFDLQEWTRYSRGGIPQAPVATGAPVFAMLLMPVGGNASTFATRTLKMNVNVLERTRYAF